MKIGFNALASFGISFEKIVQRASLDGFDVVEVLCEGPYLPRFALKDITQFEILSQYDLELTIHSPTVDLNPASVNIRIREETTKQLNETIDLAVFLDASTVTTHLGYVKRINQGVTKLSLIHISEPTILLSISYAVFCLKKEKKQPGVQTAHREQPGRHRRPERRPVIE